MKICFSTDGSNTNSLIMPNFGRCKNFLIYDTDTGHFEIIPNPGVQKTGGAGVIAAQTVVDHRVDRLVTGVIGPNAGTILEQTDITIITRMSGIIEDYLISLHSDTSVAAVETTGAHLERPQKTTISSPSISGNRRDPAGYCKCPKCDKSIESEPGVPCFKIRCPFCGGSVERVWE